MNTIVDKAVRWWRFDGVSFPRVQVVRAVPAVLIGAVLAFVAMNAGRTHVEEMDGLKPGQEMREIAVRLGVADGTSYLFPFSGQKYFVTPLMQTMGHYPFVDDWHLDCGLLGQRLEEPEPHDSSGQVVSGKRMDDSIVISGRISSKWENRQQCVVITDGVRNVIGAATLHRAGQPSNGERPLVFKGIAPTGEQSYRVFVVPEGADRPVPVSTRIAASAIEEPG